MSIIISITIPEGIVVAADSRQSYTNRKDNARIGSDFASKVFQLSPRIVVATFGWAFLQPQNANTLMSVGALVEDFRATMDVDISVSEAANQLANHFQQIYNYDVTTLQWKLPPAGNIALGFHVAGYNRDSTIGEIYLCEVPLGQSMLLRNTNSAGCNWNGQIDAVSRLVLGVDPRIFNLPFVQHVTANPIPNQETINSQLNGLQYVINWPYFTLQDAIDFATLMVNSTIKMQRFSDGVFMNPGDIAGCGGDIDIAVITHREGFKWIQKKQLRGEI